MYAFDPSRLLVKATWPLVIAKIELDLHLARHKQLCSASAPMSSSTLSSHFPLSLSSRSSSVLLKPSRMTPKIIEKPAQSATKTSNLLFKKGMGGREIEERLKKKSEEERGDFFG